MKASNEFFFSTQVLVVLRLDLGVYLVSDGVVDGVTH